MRLLVPVSTLLLGLVLAGAVLGISLFAFGSYAEHLRRVQGALVAAARSAAENDPHQSAATLARRLVPHASEPTLLLMIVDGTQRVAVRWETRSERGAPLVIVHRRDDRSAEPVATNAFARLVLGMGTIFGLQTLRTYASGFEIYSMVNADTFPDVILAFAPAFTIAVIVALTAAVLVGRVLTRVTLDPLDRVTAALRRFAEGDFSAEPIAGPRDGRLGALAAAYDGAVAQVERSFAERARAHAAMRQFISDAGHQFKTPLTVIRGLTTILGRSSIAPDSEEREIVRTIARQTSLMSALVEKLLLLEGWEARDALPNPLDAGTLVQDATRPIALAHPERALTVDAPAGFVVRADPHELEYAIVNVVDNAVKYTPGPIRVELDGDRAEVRIRVSDAGPGLDPDQAARAFDRFFRGSRRDVEGSGLGLAIAQRALERAGGRVELRSDVRTGTVVTITLPRVSH